jgi:acetyl esterase/lipase
VSTITVHTSVTYDTQHELCAYDLFVPSGARVAPLVVLIHGGAWTGGHRLRYHETCLRLAEEGMAAASVGYRLHPEVNWPDIAYDVLRGMAHLLAHARDYGIDATRAVTWGSSSGGHLALVLQARAAEWVQAGVVPAAPQILGTVAQCPVLMVPDPEKPDLGGPAFVNRHAPTDISPLHMDPKRFSSVLVVHGNQDAVIPLLHAQKYVTQLRGAGVDAELEVLRGAPHGFGYDLAGEHAQACLRLAVPYVRDRLA